MDVESMDRDLLARKRSVKADVVAIWPTYEQGAFPRYARELRSARKSQLYTSDALRFAVSSLCRVFHSRLGHFRRDDNAGC